MVEKGLGISMLHQLILKRTPYNIIVKELDPPIYRDICFAVRNKKTASLAVKRFCFPASLRAGQSLHPPA